MHNYINNIQYYQQIYLKHYKIYIVPQSIYRMHYNTTQNIQKIQTTQHIIQQNKHN